MRQKMSGVATRHYRPRRRGERKGVLLQQVKSGKWEVEKEGSGGTTVRAIIDLET